MLISTTTGCINFLLDDKESIKAIKEAGFDAYDFSMTEKFSDENFLSDKYIDYAKEIRNYADSIGIVCNQSHAPFPSAIPENEEFNEKMLLFIERALLVTSILGGKICIVHPCNFYTPEENRDKIFSKLMPYAKKYNVKIALENMWNCAPPREKKSPAACSSPKNFAEHIKLLDDNYFCACLDIGHAEIMKDDTTAVEMIKTLKNNLLALHVHDNDLVDDQHIMPFFGKINFKEVFKTLKDFGYNGYLTFEVEELNKNFPKELVPFYLKFMLETGKTLSKYFDEI